MIKHKQHLNAIRDYNVHYEHIIGTFSQRHTDRKRGWKRRGRDKVRVRMTRQQKPFATPITTRLSWRATADHFIDPIERHPHSSHLLTQSIHKEGRKVIKTDVRLTDKLNEGYIEREVEIEDRERERDKMRWSFIDLGGVGSFLQTNLLYQFNMNWAKETNK